MKIGIIRIDRMGDMLLTLPIIKSIKLSNPSFKIYVYGSNKNIKVLNNFKYAHKIINIDENKLTNENFDIILNFSPGWKSFLQCFKIKSKKKGSLILSSRYAEKFYSKFLIKILSKIFFNETLFVNRISQFKKNLDIHQTQLMFNLVSKCNIYFKESLGLEQYLPKYKNINSKKNICLLHLSSKWINKYYNENDFLKLINILKNKFDILLTSDETTKNKFNLIYKKFSIIKNTNFNKFNKTNGVHLFEYLNFEDWSQLIYSSNIIITPECGCSHLAGACKINSKIIYDPDNKPDMIYAEYAPWKSNHEKFIFSEKNLNLLLTKNL